VLQVPLIRLWKGRVGFGSDDVADDLLVGEVDFGETAVGGLTGGDGVVGEPAAIYRKGGLAVTVLWRYRRKENDDVLAKP
jgi:hypothetical protein